MNISTHYPGMISDSLQKHAYRLNAFIGRIEFVHALLKMIINWIVKGSQIS